MTSSRSSERPPKLARAWRALGRGLGYVAIAPVLLLFVLAAALSSWLWPEPDSGEMTKDEWRWS